MKEPDVAKVRSQVSQALTAAGLPLRFVTMEYGQIETIPSGAEAAPEERQYAEGRRVPLTFSDEIRTGTAEVNFATALIGLKNEAGKSKYEEPDVLFSVVGTGGTGTEAEESEVRRFGEMVLRTSPELPQEDVRAALETMQQRMGSEPQFEEVNSFASAVAVEMQRKALLALGASLLAVIAYLWYRFERIEYGLAAVVAVIHDVLMVVALVGLASFLAAKLGVTILGLEDFKINLTLIAALMTVLGYSLNDTIVIFDRVREIRGKNPNLDVNMLNLTMNQTLSRTILTSLTVFIVVLIMYAIGGEGIHGFAFALVVGTLVGSYSTIFIASPFLLWLTTRRRSAARPAAAAPARTAAASR